MACAEDTRKLSDILPYILPNCTALPEEMGMDYGRRAYIEFVRRAGAISKVLNYDLQEGVYDYPLEAPEGYLISRVNWVSIENGQRVEPTFDGDALPRTYNPRGQGYAGGAMNGSYGYGPNYWCSSGPWQFHMHGYDCLNLLKAPTRDCENGIAVSIAVFPMQDTCTFDDDFFDRWVEGIAYGALAKALMLPNTDWYNPVEAKNYERKFSIEIQRARHKVDLNYSRGPMRMKAKRFV